MKGKGKAVSGGEGVEMEATMGGVEGSRGTGRQDGGKGRGGGRLLPRGIRPTAPGGRASGAVKPDFLSLGGMTATERGAQEAPGGDVLDWEAKRPAGSRVSSQLGPFHSPLARLPLEQARRGGRPNLPVPEKQKRGDEVAGLSGYGGGFTGGFGKDTRMGGDGDGVLPERIGAGAAVAGEMGYVPESGTESSVGVESHAVLPDRTGGEGVVGADGNEAGKRQSPAGARKRISRGDV